MKTVVIVLIGAVCLWFSPVAIAIRSVPWGPWAAGLMLGGVVLLTVADMRRK